MEASQRHTLNEIRPTTLRGVWAQHRRQTKERIMHCDYNLFLDYQSTYLSIPSQRSCIWFELAIPLLKTHHRSHMKSQCSTQAASIQVFVQHMHARHKVTCFIHSLFLISEFIPITLHGLKRGQCARNIFQNNFRPLNKVLQAINNFFQFYLLYLYIHFKLFKVDQHCALSHCK